MLCSMKELLQEAAKEQKAVGALNAYNMESVRGIIRAAEELETPVILQIAESRFPYAPFDLMAPMMVNAARLAGVKVAVHLDHGTKMENIRAALDYGFTSVMFDGSRLPLQENIEKTCQVMELAKSYQAAVEAEIGCVGGNEGAGDIADNYTKPQEAETFFEATHVDALAIAIGNAHGNYKKEPKLNFEILQQIAGRVDCPLVLHGGSGIPFADFQTAIRYGIRKINIATAFLNTMQDTIKSCQITEGKMFYLELSRELSVQVAECAKRHIRCFSGID